MHGSIVVLRGEPLVDVIGIEVNQLKRLTKTESISEYFQLFVMQIMELTEHIGIVEERQVSTVIAEFVEVFEVPLGLPSNRDIA